MRPPGRASHRNGAPDLPPAPPSPVRAAAGSMATLPMPRNLVIREDGKLVNVARKQGQLFVCVTGCCCGRTESGHPAVPVDLYHEEWERRRLRNRVHLTQAGCLGPCPLANVALLVFDGHNTWFHSINDE